MTYCYQITGHGHDTNGNARWSVSLYRRQESWSHVRPDGKRVQVSEFVKVGHVYGRLDVADDARNWLRGTWSELPTVQGIASTWKGEGDCPALHHRDVFDVFGKPAHVLISQLSLRATRVGTR